MDLKGKTAVVTGASSGIGKATALMLAKEGMKVTVVARRKDRLEELAEKIESAGGEALVVEADVTDKKASKIILDQALAKWERLDMLVNNAGVMLLGPAHEAPLEEWERMVHVNLLGLLYMTHAALPIFRQQMYGHIVNVSSVAGRTTNAGSAVYNATKWGVNAFTDALRQELATDRTNVRTTLIEPGAVDTELISHNRPEIQTAVKQMLSTSTKHLESDDIARGILYAVSQPPHVSVNEILIRPTEQAR